MMLLNKDPFLTIYQGWHDYQKILTKAIAPLSAEQLSLRASSDLRSVGEIAAHVIGVRARWFRSIPGIYLQLGDFGDDFKAFGGWDSKSATVRNVGELVTGLEVTWTGMQQAISRWTPQDWEQTWPGDDDDEPEAITRAWVLWHLIEHDIYHGGQISITLQAHGVPALEL